MLVATTRGQVPDYLRCGKYFASLTEDDEAEIRISSGTMKPDTSVQSIDDLEYLLSSLSFWEVDDITQLEAFRFILDNLPRCDETCQKFETKFPVLAVVAAVHASNPEKKLAIAIDCENIQLIAAVIDQGYFPTWAHFHRRSNENNPQLIALLLRMFKQDGDVGNSTYYSIRYGAKSAVRAAGNGDLESLKVLAELGCARSADVTIAAAQNGHLHCLKYAHEMKFVWTEKVAMVASENNHLDCLRFAHKNGCPWDSATTKAAARNEHWPCLRYALCHGCPADMFSGVRTENLQCLRVFAEVQSQQCSALLVAASAAGRLDNLQLLHEAHCPWDSLLCTAAVAHTDSMAQAAGLRCLQYARAHGCPWHEDTAVVASSSGNVLALKYLHAQQFALDERCCSAAAEAGKLDALQFLRYRGCPWDSFTCTIAARYGHLACLQYAHEHGCPLIDSVTYVASQYGHLGCLQYAHEHGCPWHSDAARVAARNGHHLCLHYALHHGCPRDDVTIELAVYYGHLECLEALVEGGVSLSPAALDAAADTAHLAFSSADQDFAQNATQLHRHVQCLNYVLWNCHSVDTGGPQCSAIHDIHQRCWAILCARQPWWVVDDWKYILAIVASGDVARLLPLRRCLSFNQESTRVAARFGRLEMLVFLRRNNCPWHADTCVEAATHGHLDCLRFALNHGCACDDSCPAAAAASGRLEVLMYLHENGCPWDMATVYGACAKGHWACAVYAHQQGCPWNTYLCWRAVRASEERHESALEFAAQHEGCEWLAGLCA